MEKQGKLAAKMVAAMKAIDAVAKSGKNEKQGYKYVTAADVADEVRVALINHGISFDYDVISEDRWEKPTSSGGSMTCMQVKVGCTFTDQESGESKTVRGIGWGMDSLDKAPYKAMTGALKYVLRMNFIIPDNADPENDSEELRGQRTSRPQVQPINQQLKASIQHEDDELAFLNDDRPPQEVATLPKSSPYNEGRGPAPVSKPAKGAISEGQVKRLWAIAKQSNRSKDDVLAIVGRAGFNSVEEIGWKSYNGIIEQIQGAA